MELKPTIVATRALLREGETGKALQTLLPALENDPRQASALHTLQVLEANYNAVRQQEIKGILSFQEAQRSYSQVNDALFSALDALESGRPITGPAVNNRQFWWPWLAGAVVLLLAGLGFWFFQFKDSRDGSPKALTQADCPVFQGSGPKVLILPFTQVGQGSAKPEEVIKSRIQIMAGKRNFPIAVQLYRGPNANSDLADGESLCKQCGADMAIWGLYDYARDSVNIDLQFFTLHNPNGAFTTGFQAFRGLPDVQSGRLLSRLDDAIFGICGILAVRAGNAEVARAWFGKIQNKGAEVEKMERILEEASK